MEQSERMRLIHALAKAKNAFHKAMKEEGYHLELCSDMTTRAIVDDHKKPNDFRIVGHITITQRIDE